MGDETDVYLRPIIESDISLLFKWFNNKKIAYANGIPYRFHEFNEIRDKYTKTNPSQSSEKPLLIIDHSYNPIGIIYFKKAKPIFTGIAINIVACELEAEFLEKSLIKSIVILSEYILADIGCERVTLHLAGQLSSLEKPLKDLGFVKEAVIREERFVAGKYIDTIYMGLLKQSFIKPEWMQ